MTDSSTTLSELCDAVNAFVSARNWQVYQTPKNLSMSIAIESAELMELFQWVSNEDTPKNASEIENLNAIKDELADIFIYCLSLANVCNIDISSAVKEKLKINEIRFPTPENKY